LVSSTPPPQYFPKSLFDFHFLILPHFCMDMIVATVGMIWKAVCYGENR
jgi:hypothetical protein